MPEGPELDVELEGENGQSVTIGMNEMLYASKSTLENAEDGNILAQEYHLKLVTESFHYQVGCMPDAIETPHDTTILVEKLREIFEAVEMGNINENDYFFELMTPHFYYASGNYHLPDQVQTTLLAMEYTSLSESEEYSLQQNNVFTLLASHASYNPKVLPFLEIGQPPKYQKKGIKENDIKFHCKDTRQTKQVKRGSRQVFGNDIKSQRKAPRRTKQVKRGSSHVFWKRSVGGNCLYTSMIQLFIVVCARIVMVGALPVNTESDSPLTLTVGSDGVIPFAFRNEQQSARKYYTIKFEEKDRPFYIDGAFDLEGLMSPDQADRFRVEYFEDNSSLSVEINVASVSVEDQGTYIVILIVQGETPENHLIKRVVQILIPPGPAVCFLMLIESLMTFYEIHCHSKLGNGNSTLTCFQNGDRIPYRLNVDDTQLMNRRIFWFMMPDIPVSCCSHDTKEINTITQTSCDQFRYPRIEPVNIPVSAAHKIPTKMQLTTRPLSIEEETNQPSHESTSFSGCGLSFEWPTVMIPLMTFFTYICISNP